MEVKQELEEEVVTYYARVKFTFEGVDDIGSPEVTKATEEGLQGFYEKGYELVDSDEFFEARGSLPWTGYYIAHLERYEHLEEEE